MTARSEQGVAESHHSRPTRSTPERIQAIDPVRPVQLYLLVRDRLLERIRNGDWRAGDRLPPERDLARAFGVSRPSLREALASLELSGVLRTQQGSGSYLTESAPRRAERLLGNGSATDLSPTALLDVRYALEPAVAGLAAAKRARDPQAEELLAFMAEPDGKLSREQRDQWSEADRQFHRRLAQLSANPLFEQISALVYSTMNERLWRRLRDHSLTIPGRLTAGMEEHRQIYEAIARGDRDAAATQAARHISIVRETMDLAE